MGAPPLPRPTLLPGLPERAPRLDALASVSA